MLIVICGEDSVASRQYVHTLQQDYQKKGYRIHTVPPTEVEDIQKNAGGSISLFGEELVYVTEGLSKTLSRKRNDDSLTALATNKTIVLIDWEPDKSAYTLSKLKGVASTLKEFKPEKSIFQLLDSCYPNNLRNFLQTLTVVSQTQEETFVFAMLTKHLRSLILAKENALDSKVSPWQKKNLLMQAAFWPIQKLVGFYDGLVRIDIAIKTSGTPFSIRQSLDILACHYL